MKIQPYIQKLHNSSEYKEFEQKYKNSFLIAGFFVIDFETGNNVHQIDYYVPSVKKVAAFTLDKNIQVQLLNTLDKRVPKELDIQTRIDLEALKGIIQDEMKNRSITSEIKKMIAVIQNIEGKKIWNVNCVLSGLDILKVHVDDDSETILKMEKSSIMDYIQRMPGKAQAQMAAATGQQPTKKDIEAKIAQLDKLKDALKQEEVKLEKEDKESSTKKVKAKKK